MAGTNIFNAQPGFTGGTDNVTVGIIPIEQAYDESGPDSYTSLLISLNESLADSSSYNNTPSSDGTPVYSAGVFSQAGNFDTQWRVNYPSATQFDLSSGSWTIDMWINMGSAPVPNDMHFLNKAASGAADWFCQYYTNNHFRFGSSSGSWFVETSTVSIEDGEFHHLEFAYDGSTLRIFLDGTSIFSGALGGSISQTGGRPVCIGAISDSYSNRFEGLLDEVRISKGIARHTANFTPPTVPYSSGNAVIDFGDKQAVSSSPPLIGDSFTNKTYVDTRVNFVTGDIQETSFNASDNQSSPADVTGLNFTNASVRAFECLLKVSRGTSHTVYKILGIQKDASWELDQTIIGDATGLTFSITNAGQVQYTSTNTGSGATLKFRAFVLSV